MYTAVGTYTYNIIVTTNSCIHTVVPTDDGPR